MEVPQKYIELMSDTASTEIKWLSDDEVKAISKTRSIDEWLVATCGVFPAQDEQQLFELSNRINTLSGQEQSLLNALMAKMDRFGQCVRGKMARFRDAMAPPDAAVIQKTPEAAGPPPCPPDQLRLAKEFLTIPSVERGLHALELCPAELCPSLGRFLIQHSVTLEFTEKVAHLCPKERSARGQP